MTDDLRQSLVLQALDLSTNSLAALARRIAPEDLPLWKAVTDALCATRQALGGPAGGSDWQLAAEACERLAAAAGQADPTASAASMAAPEPLPRIGGAEADLALTDLAARLHALSARLVGTDAGDQTRLTDIALDLWQLGQDADWLASVSTSLDQALRNMAPLCDGSTNDAAGDYARAAHWIDEASFALQDAALAADLVPACAAAAAMEPLPGAPASASASAPPRQAAAPVAAPGAPASPAGQRTGAPASGPGADPPCRPAHPARAGAGAYDPSQVESLPADADRTLLAEYVNESRDFVEQAEAALLSLEINSDDSEAVNTVFRAFHTIKGTSGFLGIGMATALAHRAENLLTRIRDKEIRCAGGYADLALRSIDQLSLVIEGVQRALGGAPLIRPEGFAELLALLDDPEAAGVSEESGRGQVIEPRVGDLLVAAGVAGRDSVESVAAGQGSQPIGEALVRSGVATAAEVGRALRTQKKIAGPVDAGADTSMRVSTRRLDRLIDMVGELVIAQSMVAQDGLVVGGQNPDLMRKVTHADKIVRELQDLTMTMRMVPLKPTFQKMARLVRDLSQRGGKQIGFVTSGEDTEIDRNMVDVLNDPLVHMIRNAVDHGVEPPDMRQRSGKSPAGCVHLAAFHAGGNVVVELSDDGRGLDRARIAQKAIERGLIESDKGMCDAEVYNLIFEAGFSTAETVTEISGRGVGMDVVRRAIQALHGRIEIGSRPGCGTTFTVRLPLTLAITDGMLLRVGAQRFILPTTSIHMSFRPEPGAVSTLIGRGEMVMLRGALVPIIRLHRLFRTPGALEDISQALLVVIEDGERRAALMVDELLGQQQVVAKSLGDGIGKVPGVSGGAILGDGRVGLILDPGGLGALARSGGCSSPPIAAPEPAAEGV